MADGMGIDRATAGRSEIGSPAKAAPLERAARPSEAPRLSREARFERQRERQLLEDEIMTIAAEIDAATHRFLTLLREFDERNGWVVEGVRSFPDWLSWKTGLTLGVAREKIRVAKALADLPQIDDGLRRGVISYSKARALTRVATPENDTTLAEMALNTSAAQLEKICRGIHQVQAADEEHGRPDVATTRFLHQRVTEDGMVRITLQVHPDEAALLTEAIEAMRSKLHEVRPAQCAHTAIQNVSAEAFPQDEPDLPYPGKVDAFMELVREASGGERMADHLELFVHLHEDALGQPGAVTLHDGTRIEPETFRRISCDAGLVPYRTGERGQVLDVGRKTRTIPPAIRRALQLRDPCCAFPGCTHDRWLDAHHIEHWAHGGETQIENLLHLCSFHHHCVHEGGFRVEPSVEGHGFVFRRPNGKAIASPVPVAIDLGVEALVARNQAAGLEIDAETAMSGTYTRHPDYRACIEAGLS